MSTPARTIDLGELAPGPPSELDAPWPVLVRLRRWHTPRRTGRLVALTAVGVVALLSAAAAAAPPRPPRDCGAGPGFVYCAARNGTDPAVELTVWRHRLP